VVSLWVGGKKRICHITMYLRIKDGKIWVEEDWTDLCVVDDLLAPGILKSDIVLRFHAPYKRKFTGLTQQNNFYAIYGVRCAVRTLQIEPVRKSCLLSLRLVDAINAIVREEKLRGDRYLLMLKLRTVAKGKMSCQNKTSLRSLRSNRVSEVVNLVFEA
jgi:XisI protein